MGKKKPQNHPQNQPTTAPTAAVVPQVVVKSETIMKNPAVDAIERLLDYLSTEQSNTFQEFHQNIRANIDSLKKEANSAQVECAAEIFLRYVSLKSGNYDENLGRAKEDFKKRAQKFLCNIRDAKSKVGMVGNNFISDSSVILTHGYSEAVVWCFNHALKAKKKFTVYVTESRTSANEKSSLGSKTCEALKAMSIDHVLITDSSIAYFMGRVDLVLVGAEAVVKNGGVINTIGCYPVALCAKKYNKPVYVAVEKFKFNNIYPLSQEDALKQSNYGSHDTTQPKVDYTPPEFLNLLFTDLGPLTTAAVSDVMIELYS